MKNQHPKPSTDWLAIAKEVTGVEWQYATEADYSTFETFSLCGRDRITAAQLIIILAGSDPNAPWLRDARLDLMTAWAEGAVQNLERDINDGIIRPLALGHKFGHRDRASDAIDINDADAFVRRIGGSKYWTALWAEREQQTRGGTLEAAPVGGELLAASEQQRADQTAAATPHDEQWPKTPAAFAKKYITRNLNNPRELSATCCVKKWRDIGRKGWREKIRQEFADELKRRDLQPPKGAPKKTEPE